MLIAFADTYLPDNLGDTGDLAYQLNPIAQVSLALRALQFASLYRQLGPLWVTITSMLKAQSPLPHSPAILPNPQPVCVEWYRMLEDLWVCTHLYYLASPTLCLWSLTRG